MSRSYKKAIFKSKDRFNEVYNKVTRKRNKTLLKKYYDDEDLQFKLQRELVNDYNICDLVDMPEYWEVKTPEGKKWLKKFRRK